MANERTLDEIQKAIRAHGTWKLKLKTAIKSGNSTATPEDVACDNLCEFGQWLHHDTMPAAMRESKPYQVILRLHAEFHETAASVLTDALSGDTVKAEERMAGDFAAKSEKLVDALMLWKSQLRRG